MDERRLKFFLALQKKVEESGNLSPKAKEKFYALAEGSIGEPAVVEDSAGEVTDFAKVYREHGFVSIPLDEMEVKIEDKRKKVGLDLNKHRPIDVTSFLSLFGSQSHPLKYLVHDFNIPGKPFNLNEFLKIIKDSFSIESKKYSLPDFLKGRIAAFIGINKKDWYFKRQKSDFSFFSNKVNKWCAEFPDKHPFFGFESEIKFFKESIRIDGNLKEVIEFVLAQKGLLTSFDIEYQNCGTAKFYTDVDALISGLGVIFGTVNYRIQNGRKLKIAFETKTTQTERLRIIKIVHVDSECNKELIETELISGDLKDAKKFFYQLCDWSIIAKNPNPEINKINILYNPATGKNPREKMEDPIEGFTHVLTFYS